MAALERSRVLPRKLERGINHRPCHSCQLLARRGSRRWGAGTGGGVSEQDGLESWQIRIRGTGGERFCLFVQSQGDPWGHREKQPADTETETGAHSDTLLSRADQIMSSLGFLKLLQVVTREG